MANVYFYNSEDIVEWAGEDKQGVCPESGSFNGFGLLRSASFAWNENIELWTPASGGAQFRKNSQYNKGVLDITGSLTFWMPDDFDATCCSDAFFLKYPLDAYNVAHSTSAWVVPNTGASAYGSFDLKPFTMEMGHNKSGSIKVAQLLGCQANSLAVNLSEGEKIEFVSGFKSAFGLLDVDAFTNASATQSTGTALNWDNCDLYFGDDGSEAIKTVFTALSFTVDNESLPNRVIADAGPIIDALDTASDWTADGTDATAPAANTSIYKIGTQALSLGKTGSSATDVSWTQALTVGMNLTGRSLYMWVYVADAQTLTDLDTSASSEALLTLGTAGFTNANEYDLSPDTWAVGWNLVGPLAIDSADSTQGSGATVADLDNMKITYNVDETDDTIGSDKVIMNYLWMTTPRGVYEFIPGKQTIAGTFTINKSTTSGMQIWADITGDSSQPYIPTETATAKSIKIIMKNRTNPATQNLQFYLRKVRIGEGSQDFEDGGRIQQTFPFTAEYYSHTITTTDDSAPNSWDDQS